MSENLSNIRDDEEEICDSQPISFPSFEGSTPEKKCSETKRPPRNTGQKGHFRSIEEIDPKYRHVFNYPYFNLVQSRVIDDALYSNKSMVVCAPTGSGKTVIFEMAILQLLMELEDKKNTDDFKIIYMAPVKALCTERITEWYSKFMKLGLLCIEVTGDTDVDFPQLKPYRIIITTPEKWDMLTRRWMEHNLVKIVKLFLIDEVHILNDEARGPVLEAVVSRMKTVESSVRSGIRLVAVSATISNPEDVAAWLGAGGAPAVHYKFGDECRPVKLTRVVEGYPCSSGTSIFKFDIILNYKLWPIIQKYHNGKPTLIFCNTRKSVMLTAETLSREITVGFNPEQREKLIALASTIKNKKIQSLVVSGVGCHHAGLLFEERANIEQAFRNRDLPILITTTTLAMGVNLPAHLVIIKNTQQYINGAYQEYSISTVLQMVGRAGRPQYDSHATAVIMTRLQDKARYQSLVGGSEPLQSFLHKRLAENINSEIALGTIGDVAQCVQWLNSTFLKVRVAKDPKRYLGLPSTAPSHLITKKIEELCVRAMNGLESSGLVTMDELSCIESTEAGRLMSLHYLDLETMKLIMKIDGTETLEKLLWLVCESHELSDMHLRVDERRCLNSLNRNNSAPTIRYQMKGKISSRQMKLNCVIQSVLGCLPIPDPSLNQEALKIMRTADRVCKCLVSYVTRPNLISQKPKFYTAILNALILAKCITAHLWENSLYVSRQLRGIGPTFSTLLASAGKTNFMLLGESHPRDLERIMNKGPPAGNILRKQISLLPNYNITITPINEQTIRIQLSLLNQSYLAENIDTLTAGSGHKSYIVVGDSENLLLYLSSFKDSDLINIYEGSISFEVSRIHLNEHKVIAHCISSSFVGIDNRCEHIFKNINPLPLCVENTLHNETPRKISPNRQTYITDVFKERKRKYNDKESPISKEKKTRESFSIDKFKTLQESFERTSKEIKEKCKESKVKTVLENSIGVQPECNKTPEMAEPNFNEVSYDIEDNDFLDDFEYKDIGNEHINISNEQINNLVKEIEDEVNHPSKCKFNSMVFKVSNNNESNKNNSRTFNKEKTKFNVKDNYSFIDRLEKKNSEYENDNLTSNKDVGFSDSIKCYVQEFFKQTKDNIKHSTTEIIKLVDKEIDVPNTSSSECKESIYNNDIPEDIQHIKNADIPKENVDIIDLKHLSPISSNYNISPELRIVPIKTKEVPLDNIELKISQMQKETKTIDTIAKKSLVSAECSLIPYEPRIASQMNVAKELQTFKRSNDIKISNVEESRDNHNKRNLFSIYQNQNIADDCKDIKKYSFNAIKTFGVHNKNVSKICTLKVALDVTEIVHDKDNYNQKCDDSKHIIKNINDHNNFDNVNTVLQLEDNINNKSLNNTNNRHILYRQQQINEPPNIISDKSTIYTQAKNNETTLKDILNRYNKRLNDIQVEEIELDNSTSRIEKKIKNPEIKQKRKYRISDLDTMDIILPDSLVPIKNQFINNTKVNYKTNNNNLYKSLPVIEERIKASTINTNSADKDLNITSNATYISEIDDDEDDSDDESKIDLNPSLEETLNHPDIDLYKIELDPKILLRSLNNEEILQPPPEFCDSDYSPISPLNTSNIIDIHCDDSNYNDIPLADNIFDNTFNDDSRSSTETNSCNLSRTHENLFMYHPTSSHNTIINRNPSESSRSDFVKSGISKLSQFKFKRKEMLKK